MFLHMLGPWRAGYKNCRSKLFQCPDKAFLSRSALGVGLQYDKQQKMRYGLHGKKSFPATSDGLLSFNVKGQCDADKDLKRRSLKELLGSLGAYSIFRRTKILDPKFGYEVVEKVPYVQIKENNWTLNVDYNGRWDVRFDL
ncbi:Outer envelope pore protein like [Quillaja saponaria]|uniref:Outer envelope pore protein like n=1 Tax=Quillaja saponaria TaxID=32244 RepID=A0AAD7LZB2_QUISA|nr:Outer envelope pore protein like [Quillaja saponaria]